MNWTVLPTGTVLEPVTMTRSRAEMEELCAMLYQLADYWEIVFSWAQGDYRVYAEGRYRSAIEWADNVNHLLSVRRPQ